tara:strand:- start:448 stop:744 length:297 start_codon:yes stop_codon:yes gene_type:complete
MIIAGKILIGFGLFFIAAGVCGLFRFDNFYARLLVASKIDTVGSILVLTGVMFIHGFSMFTLKVLLILGLMICINPLSAHTLARIAHIKGYALRKEKV